MSLCPSAHIIVDPTNSSQLNGFWLFFFLGRWSMITGWIDLVRKPLTKDKQEFVSADAHVDLKKDPHSYEMLSRDSYANMSLISPAVISPAAKNPPADPMDGRRTPDYFGRTARYHAPARSFSSPRPPPLGNWDPESSYAMPIKEHNPYGTDKV